MRERGRLTRGTVLGDLVVDRLLGEGVVAEVYAVDTSEGRRALKLARPGLEPALHEALRVEARLQARARSAHVVAVDRLVEIDVDGGDRRPGLLMERIDGPTLDRWLLHQDASVPIPLALSLFAGVARGTRAIHAAGVVHGDLKPDNVLLDRVSDAWFPKITDFGMAVAASAPKGARDGAVGAPAYMAPEQALGAAAPSALGDLYSLGCILYELLCAEVPYPAREPGDVLRRSARADYRPIGALRADAGPALEALVADLLQPAPERRIASADELLRRVDALA